MLRKGLWVINVFLVAGVIISIGLFVWNYKSSSDSLEEQFKEKQNSKADREALVAELARITESGDPLTTEEMRQAYRLPPDTPDLTKQWQTAIEPFMWATFYR